MKTKDMILIAIFAALSAVGAFIKIPMPFCPITLQVLFTTLAGVLLGGKKGALSVAVYVALGLMGVPVFTGGGGISYILHPTFGFLIGFVIGAFVTGTICHGGEPTKLRLFVGAVTGLLPVFALGTAYVAAITFLYMKSEAKLIAVLSQCLLPLPGDVILCVFTAFLGSRIIPVLKKEDLV